MGDTLRYMDRRIQNSEVLATTALRTDALAIAAAGYAAIDTGEALRRKLHLIQNELHIGDAVYPLEGRKVFFVGIGKCAFDAAEAIETLLGDTLTAGIALDVASTEGRHLTKIETIVGTHPLPSEANVHATKRIVEFLSGRTENDLVLMLISGGGSTLLCSPVPPMTCIDESTLFSELSAQGASIQDINTVRKHTSQARGGNLAAAAFPAEVMSLIISDVPGNDITSIASGPTVLDTSTIADAKAIFAKYNVLTAKNIAFLETPKEPKYFERVKNILLVTSEDALAAMQDEAVRRGYTTEIPDHCLIGEAREIAHAVTEKLHAAPAKTAFLYAGESTVTIAGSAGAGGRNQEMALAALLDIRDDELVLPLASDGHDNTDHAGAIADSDTQTHARTKNLSIETYLDAHRSYDFFTTTDDALITGYTGSNVSDLIIALKK